jgi:hypothetical protein
MPRKSKGAYSSKDRKNIRVLELEDYTVKKILNSKLRRNLGIQ